MLDLLRPAWIKHRSASQRLASHLRQVFDWSIQTGYRTTNPASGHVTKLLGQQPPHKHHPAAPYTKLGVYLAKIRDSDYWWAARYSIIFLAFTEDRSGEATEATWEEIDMDEATLTIPVHRMKGDIEHVIPLPTQAMDILRLADSKGRHSKGTIFPPQRGGLSMDSGRLSEITRELKLPFVPHGLRSSSKDWVTEKHPECRELAEMSLAHVVGTATERAYRRTILLPQRRALLQEYADFLTETMGLVILPKDR